MIESDNRNEKNGLWDKVRFCIRKCMLLAAAFGFFGLMYPDLCMVEDTCKVILQTADGEEEIIVPKGSELYYSLLSAKPQDIKIKSKLLETLQSYFERNKQEE